MLVKAGISLAGQIIGLFGARGKATQEALKARQESMQRTWTDEFITVVWFSPLLVAWVEPDRATAWIDAVLGQNPEYVAIVASITAAVFGLGKIGVSK